MGLRRSLAALAIAGMLAVSVTACGSGDDDATPTARGPVLAGHATCVYVNTPAECQDSGVDPAFWQQAPAQQPVVHDSSYDLWMWLLMYHTWYSSPYYVNHYVPVAQRTVYHEHWVVIDRTYASQERTYQSKATYRTRSGKTVTGNKVKTTQFKAPAPKNNGGQRGKLCNTFMAIGLDKSGGGSSGSRTGSSGSRTGGGLSKLFGGKPKPKPASGTGGDRGKGGTSQHGC